jgi:hypothetical protein
MSGFGPVAFHAPNDRGEVRTIHRGVVRLRVAERDRTDGLGRRGAAGGVAGRERGFDERAARFVVRALERARELADRLLFDDPERLLR